MNMVPVPQDTQDCCVLLFVKYPEKEKVKHRLAKSLSEDIAVEVYRNFVLDTLAMLEELTLPFYVCYYPPGAQKKFFLWLGTQYQFLPQQGVDLGERMCSCFTQVFALGFHRVILIGSDSPDLPCEYLREAFAGLQKKDVVLGPAVDGGYYLIGFRDTAFTPSAFEKIHWSTPSVFAETMAKLQKTDRTVHLLPSWSDVDTISDLRNLERRATNTAFKSSRTITYLREHHIITEDEHGG
ncbi:MAG TPA: TIGR04282 family arsenosugar biosynthesis glycosyltransferase [Candidatus Thermoplasmatota archaeon]|nr:TIGR04282 family arsenosugar biosynthesis glycosyltransferase [Candidatus Thermoplasmatota archaeon]